MSLARRWTPLARSAHRRQWRRGHIRSCLLKSITFCDSVGRSAGVVGDQQRTAGRDAAEVPDLGTEVALGDWPQEADDAFGQHRVPLGDPRTRQVRAFDQR